MAAAKALTQQPNAGWAPAFALRSFPVPSEHEGGIAKQAGAKDPKGTVGAEWSQTMGTVTLVYRLQGGPREDVEGGWDVQDILVEMSQKNVKVTVGGEVDKALSGELLNLIWRHRSWWTFEAGVLTMHFYKRELRTWQEPWYFPNMALMKRQAFPWTKAMLEHGSNHTQSSHGMPKPQDLPDESELAIILPGRPETDDDEAQGSDAYFGMNPAYVFGPPSERYICSPEDVCIGITAEQDHKFVVIQVHFDRFAYENLKCRVCLEALLAADVGERDIRVFFQGDRLNPVVWAELGGFCIMEDSRWKLVSSETMRRSQRELGSYSPALQLKLRKATPGMWDKVFVSCMHHRLMVKEWDAETGRPVRFDGPPGSKPLMRAGYNLQEPDFWGHVDNYVRATIKRSGYTSAPKKLEVAA